MPRSLKVLATLLAPMIILSFSGCEGTESREKVDEPVEEMAGKKDLDRYQEMKKDLDKIREQRSDRYQDLDDAAGQESDQ